MIILLWSEVPGIIVVPYRVPYIGFKFEVGNRSGPYITQSR